jgi:DNA-binding CsgD family transcriptional regulator
LSQAEMRLSAASRSVDNQRNLSPPLPSSTKTAIGILRPAALIAAILRRPEPIMVLAAAAGMGKSTLLRIFSANKNVRFFTGLRPPDPPNRGAMALWDIPLDGDPFPLTDFHLHSEGRLVIAKRPEQRLQGLERAVAYGAAVMIDDEALCLREEDLRRPLGATKAREIIAKTGGWPILVKACLADCEPDAVSYSFQEMYAGLAEDVLVRAERALATDSSSILPPPGLFREIARREARREIQRRAFEPTACRRLASAFAGDGSIPDAVRVLQQAGLEEEALAAFVKAGGWAFIFHFGPQAFDDTLARFSEVTCRRSEPLVIALAFQALKRGDIPRARHLIAERIGPAASDPRRIFAAHAPYSVAMRSFCFLMMLYEGVNPEEDLFERGFATLAEVPIEADLERGSFYNAALELRIRENRFAEATDLAQRALFHYERANVAILCFYICIHLAVIALNTGDANAARRRCETARAWLVRVPYGSPGDSRILSLVEACVGYESGQAEALMTFLADEADRLTLGETWPSLVELAVQYGAQALGEHYSTRAALAFVESWRVHGLKSQAVKLAIELRGVIVLQNANRWDDAEEALRAASPKLTRERILAGTADLARLRDRESLLCALAWMRQIAFRSPRTPGLERRLATLRNNLALSPRQRIGVDVWLAYVWRVTRDIQRARTTFKALLEEAAESGVLAPLAAERVFLSELTAQRQIAAFAETSPHGRQTLRKLSDLGFAPRPAGAKLGLTRQETKLLLLACRGATNKDAAKALGLSEATVKFHLGNAYRKLGCRRRSEATAAAHALGIVR